VLKITVLYHRKQAKLHRVQNPSHTNGDNANDIRCETNRTFMKKQTKKTIEYLEEKINDL
jgi:hypothetical protein